MTSKQIDCDSLTIHLKLQKVHRRNRHIQRDGVHRQVQGNQMLLLQPELVDVRDWMVVAC